MTGRDRYMVDDTWESVALPIMRTVAEIERTGKRPNFDQILQRLEQDRSTVEREFRQLVHAQYLGGIDASSVAAFDMIEIHLHERGKVAVGEWPGEDALAAMIRLIEERIEDEIDPQKRSGWQRLRDALISVGTGAGGTLLAEVVRAIAR